MENNDKLQFIESIMLLMKLHIINEVEVEGIKITKTRHILDTKTDEEKDKEKATDLLFASSGIKTPKDFDMKLLFADPFQNKDK